MMSYIEHTWRDDNNNEHTDFVGPFVSFQEGCKYSVKLAEVCDDRIIETRCISVRELEPPNAYLNYSLPARDREPIPLDEDGQPVDPYVLEQQQAEQHRPSEYEWPPLPDELTTEPKPFATVTPLRKAKP